MSGMDDAYLRVLEKERNDDYQRKNKYMTAPVVGFAVGLVGIGLFQ